MIEVLKSKLHCVRVTCSGVKTLQLEGVQATWIQDNAGEIGRAHV